NTVTERIRVRVSVYRVRSPVIVRTKSCLECFGQERQASRAVKFVHPVKDLLLGSVGRPEYFVDFLSSFEAFPRGGDGENRIARAAFGEQRPRGNQTRDVVHLGPIQNSRHVIIDAMRQAHDAGPKRVQVTAHESGADAGFERGGEKGAGAAAGD